MARNVVEPVGEAAPTAPLCLDRPGTAGESFNIAAADTPTMATLMRDVVAQVGSRSRVVSLPKPVARTIIELAKRLAESGIELATFGSQIW